jgi:hypothetical protein
MRDGVIAWRVTRRPGRLVQYRAIASVPLMAADRSGKMTASSV